jgi:hypothetical protein
MLFRGSVALLALVILIGGAATPAVADSHDSDNISDLDTSDFCSGGLGQLIGFVVTFLTFGGIVGGYVLVKADTVRAIMSGGQQGYAQAKEQASTRIRMILALVLFDFGYLALSTFTPLPGFGCAITSLFSV